MISRFFAAMLLLGGMLSAQPELLQSGPMVGYSEMREVMVWAQTTEPAEVHVEFWPEGDPDARGATVPMLTDGESAHIAWLVIGGLEPGTRYRYALYINGEAVPRDYRLSFQTQMLWQWRTDPPPVEFVIGSCAYVNDTAYDRPGTPYGSDYQIFKAIYDEAPDFMIWLGDNVYLREADWYSRSGILDRYTHTRSLPEMQPLLGALHHYAIWDDHDYGPNNSDRSFRMKDVTLEAFRLFWGNPEGGLVDQPGITTMFQWADLEFFLLDNRYHRSPNARVTGERTILGAAQFEWLIDALAASYAPFKFVVIGGQVLNSVESHENYAVFAAERERLLRAIRAEGITGVFFLTGDRHHTELSRMERRGTYPLYDLTISSLTAGPNPRAVNEPNDYRVDGTFLGEHNYGRLVVTGPRTERVLTITTFDAGGAAKWERVIPAAELR